MADGEYFIPSCLPILCSEKEQKNNKEFSITIIENLKLQPHITGCVQN